MKSSHEKLFSKKRAKGAWVAVMLLTVGVSVSLLAVSMSTDNRQLASDINLNSTDSQLKTINADKTMGPPTELANLSQKLTGPKSDLTVKVGNIPTTSSGKNEKGKGNAKKATEGNTPQLTSLVLKVTKVEVHLAQLIPPQNINNLPADINGIVPSPNSNSKGKTDKVTGADKWETIDMDESVAAIDLVQLAQTNVAETLGLARLACGRYTEIRLYVKEAYAAYDNSETSIKLTIPGNSGIVKIVRPFVIEQGESQDIRIDFDAQKSVVKAGNNYILKPVVARIEHK